MAAPLRVILNPAAAGGKARGVRGEIERELAARGLRALVQETNGPGDAVALARQAAAEGAGVVAAAGGDGTIHEVANGLLQARADGTTPAALGVIPIGTGNDFAKQLGLTRDRSAAYDALARSVRRTFDVGRVSWRGGAEFFVNGMGTGVDVEVVRQIERLPRLPGVVSYLIGAVRALIGFRAIPLRVTIDGRSERRNVMLIGVGNGTCIGGGFYLFPGARPDDGRLDVCIVNDMGYARIARVLPKVLRGQHVGLDGVESVDAVVIEIESLGSEPLFFQLDGELREPAGARSLRVEIARAALPVVTAS